MSNNGVIWCEPGKRPNTFIYHVQNGFYYHFESELINTIYFKCKSSSCTGRAKLLRSCSRMEETVAHNHPPDHLYHRMLALRRKIVGEASSSRYLSFIDIVHLEKSRIPDRHLRSLVNYRSLRSAMQRARNAIFPYIPNSLQSLSDILQNPAWNHLTQTSDQSDNLYSGSLFASDGSHAVVFISRRCINILRQVAIVFADSTFCIAPSVPQCYQVFTMVSIDGHTVIPLLWVLMERKSESAYVGVLSYIRDLLGYWSFEKVVCDFEDAEMNAFASVFNVTVQGCFFHCVNAMCTWARVNMTVTLLLQNEELLKVVAVCCALPLLPQQFIQQGFHVICIAAFNLGHYLHLLSLPFLEYIRVEWLQHVNRSRTFSVSGSEHRTNNASESNNKRMKREIGHPHPNIYHFLSKLVEFEDSTIDDMTSLQHGRQPNRERSFASVSNDALLQSLTGQLLQDPNPSNDKIFEFLCAASSFSRNLFLYALGLEAAN